MAGSAAAPLPERGRRQSLLEDLAARIGGSGARGTLINAPRGWGKREILTALARRVAGSGHPFAEIDVASCSQSPGELACTIAAAALEAAVENPRSGVTDLAGAPAPEARLRALAGSPAAPPAIASEAALVLRLMEAGSRGGGPLVRAALRQLPGVADRVGGRLAVVAHGLDAAARLAPYPGLREVQAEVAGALGSQGIRFVASVSPEGRAGSLRTALRQVLGGALDGIDLPPLDPEEALAVAGGAAATPEAARRLLAVTGGRLLTLRILGGRLAGGAPMERALAAEMEPGSGLLFQELRFDYHVLIERTRGDAACRAILNVLAREEGLDLSGIAVRLRRSPGSTLDYLKWLTEVALVAREGRRYRFTDPLLRLYVLLHEIPEKPGDPGGRALAVRRFLAGLEAPPLPLRPVGRPRGRKGTPRQAPPRSARPPAPSDAPTDRKDPPPPRRDDLIEID